MLPSITPRSTLQAAIDFSPMTDSENFNNNRPVINGVQNAVLSYSHPIPILPLQFLDTRYMRVITKRQEPIHNPLIENFVSLPDSLQLFFCFTREFYLITAMCGAHCDHVTSFHIGGCDNLIIAHSVHFANYLQ